MVSFPREIFLIFASLHAYYIPHGIGSLKLNKLDVPQVVLEGEAAILTCPFVLEEDRLYSVLWYKDHEEFYRFVPKNNPMQHSYKLEGFEVDIQMSNEQQVFLKDVTLKASGVYRCEVSAEAPSFTSVNSESVLQVIAIPDDNPEISGQQTSYSVGEIMELNCTSGKSHPPATLDWFINDHQVKSGLNFFTSDDSELFLSTTTLRLQLQQKHFFNGQMVVRCVATVGPVQSSVLISPLLVHHKETSLLVQARGASSARTSNFSSKEILVVLFGMIVISY